MRESDSALFSADGKQVLTASEDGTIKLWDAESGAVVRTLSGHSGGVTFATSLPTALACCPRPGTTLPHLGAGDGH